MKTPRRRAERRRAPWLANDVARGLAPTLPAIVLANLSGRALQAWGLIPPTIPAVFVDSIIFMLAWCWYAALVLLLIGVIFTPLDSERLRDTFRATKAPERPLSRLIWIVMGGGAVNWAILGSAISIIAVLLLATNSDLLGMTPVAGFAVVFTIIVSWLLIWLSFAVRLGRENAVNGGARFAGTSDPRFVDYAYLAVQLSTAFSSGDVQLTTSSMRRVAIANAIFAFAFNTAIIALLVSMLISAIS